MNNIIKFSLIFAFLAVSFGAINTSGSSAFSSASESEEDQIREIIDIYFLLRCELIKTNSPTLNLTSIVDTQNSRTREWLKLEQDLYEIQRLIRTVLPNKILDCQYHLDFQTIDSNSMEAIVRLIEDNQVVYEHRPTKPSITANIQHEILLTYSGNGWVIVEDRYSNDITRALENISKETIFENIRRNSGINSEGILEHDLQTSALNIPNSENELWLYNYNNVAAAIYADSFFDTDSTDGPVPSKITSLDGWNSSWSTVYKEYSNDCTNFVSQAVFEGVSYTASDPDYFYPNPINTEEWWYYKFSSVTDGSTPWIRVGDFHEFLTENYYKYENLGIEYVIRGPAAKAISLCDINIGDIVFMYEDDINPGWAHTVIVDDLDPFHCSSNNVYIAAHSDDSMHRPLSDYSEYLFYPVTIKGYFSSRPVAFLPLILQNMVALSEPTDSYPYPEPQNTNQLLYTSLYPYPEP